MNNQDEQQEQQPLKLKQLGPTESLEIDSGLTLVPRVKLNLTIYPSTPLTLTNPIDEWKMKRALLDFLHSSFHYSISVPEEDLTVKRLKDLKKRKREDAVAAGTLHVWDLGFLEKGLEKDYELREIEEKFLEWRKGLVEKLDGIELNLEGVRFRLNVIVPISDDFHGMKKAWEEFYAFQNRGYSRGKREPDTIILRGVPSRWFAEPRVSSKPSMLVTHTIFSTFGKIRNLNVAEDDDLGKEANEGSEDLISGLYCKIVVQFEKHRDFHDALRVLCSRSLQKQGSRLKADYEVNWDKDGFFWNSRNQTLEKNKVAAVAADHNRSEAPRRQAYGSRHSPDNVRPRRFKE
ncbi:PREDICTED: uncharacterized protein LOC109338976 [Lupinus angustifolius]|uniref:uncharacterized protein LOC109338976 n=1 Tax=Lupinus angustifolius TaxID=3871 RepID=UPI00092F1A5A|nr:PREDICTED: uncharacterized protein LOC109338976 [Lupinus angustifolius]